MANRTHSRTKTVAPGTATVKKGAQIRPTVQTTQGKTAKKKK